MLLAPLADEETESQGEVTSDTRPGQACVPRKPTVFSGGADFLQAGTQPFQR